MNTMYIKFQLPFQLWSPMMRTNYFVKEEVRIERCVRTHDYLVSTSNDALSFGHAIINAPCVACIIWMQQLLPLLDEAPHRTHR